MDKYAKSVAVVTERGSEGGSARPRNQLFCSQIEANRLIEIGDACLQPQSCLLLAGDKQLRQPYRPCQLD